MELSDQDYQRILDFYRQSYVQYGDSDVRSVHWPRIREQHLRFQALTQIADISSCTILDVGCGLGDLYKFLLQNQIEVDYTGVDIVPEFVKAARHRFPQGHFEVRDIFEVTDSFDYVLASGAFSFKVANNLLYYQAMMKRLYHLAKRATAFNLLDNRIHADDDTYAAYSPLEIADFCATFATRVEVVVDYLPQDFAVYLYK